MRIPSIAALSLTLMLLVGCNSYNLRYAANPQPVGANLFADYTPLQGAVGIPIDTDGRRLEEVYIKRPDGTVARPLNIGYAPMGHGAALGTGLGFGTGRVGVGTGVGIPIGPERSYGLTTATFDEAALGPPPWELHVKLNGLPEAVIPGVGGPATAR
jgi:hypothetical protein